MVPNYDKERGSEDTTAKPADPSKVKGDHGDKPRHNARESRGIHPSNMKEANI